MKREKFVNAENDMWSRLVQSSYSLLRLGRIDEPYDDGALQISCINWIFQSRRLLLMISHLVSSFDVKLSYSLIQSQLQQRRAVLSTLEVFSSPQNLSLIYMQFPIHNSLDINFIQFEMDYIILHTSTH